MKTIHKELFINIGTLNCYDKYVDWINLPELETRIRLVIKKEKISPEIKNIQLISIQEHKTDGTPCWCNPKIIKVRKSK